MFHIDLVRICFIQLVYVSVFSLLFQITWYFPQVVPIQEITVLIAPFSALTPTVGIVTSKRASARDVNQGTEVINVNLVFNFIFIFTKYKLWSTCTLLAFNVYYPLSYMSVFIYVLNVLLFTTRLLQKHYLHGLKKETKHSALILDFMFNKEIIFFREMWIEKGLWLNIYKMKIYTCM